MWSLQCWHGRHSYGFGRINIRPDQTGSIKMKIGRKDLPRNLQLSSDGSMDFDEGDDDDSFKGSFLIAVSTKLSIYARSYIFSLFVSNNVVDVSDLQFPHILCLCIGQNYSLHNCFSKRKYGKITFITRRVVICQNETEKPRSIGPTRQYRHIWAHILGQGLLRINSGMSLFAAAMPISIFFLLHMKSMNEESNYLPFSDSMMY